jgi:NADH-quinone oxidoreductase subunit J
LGSEAISFYLFGAIAIGASLLVIAQRNPVYSVLLLIASFGALSGLYVLLDAPFTAVTQIIIYAGAIMVLFLFVVMLLNLSTVTTDLRGPASLAAAIVLAGLLGIQLAALWRYTPGRLAAEVAQSPALADPSALFAAGDLARREALERGVVGGVAVPLFQSYLVPFEITSVLLLAAIVGAVVLAKRRI